jgi:urease accessory protein
LTRPSPAEAPPTRWPVGPGAPAPAEASPTRRPVPPAPPAPTEASPTRRPVPHRGPAPAGGPAPPGSGLALLLLLADGRLPAGGHAHSGGVEAAVAAGLISGAADLEAYLDGRLATTGHLDAAVAVASWWRMTRHPAAVEGLVGIDAEVSARLASPAQRAASRVQGRGLLRVARRCWSAPVLDALGSLHPDGPLAPMVLGGAGAVGALCAVEIASAALWSAVSGAAWAAVRLLGLDPLEVTATLSRLAPAIDAEAGGAAAGWGRADRAPAELPAPGAPLSEIGAEAHAAWEVRLFAS